LYRTPVIFIFCHFFPSLSKKTLLGFPAAVLNFRLFRVDTYSATKASYREANYNVANYYFSNDDRVHSKPPA